MTLVLRRTVNKIKYNTIQYNTMGVNIWHLAVEDIGHAVR